MPAKYIELSTYPILYEDDDLIAVHKPTGIFVHRSNLDPSAKIFMVQEVRNLIGSRVYPVHRLDRKTSGLLLMAKSQQVQAIMNKKFKDRHVIKKYLAIVRGYTADQFRIDYPIMSDKGKMQDAVTFCTTLQKVEIPISSGKFETSRYSLVEAHPLTGRMHQIRRHLSHIFHPIIGDRPHGCNKQNRFFLQNFELNDMMLHAATLEFDHPISSKEIKINAPVQDEFLRMFKTLGFD